MKFFHLLIFSLWLTMWPENVCDDLTSRERTQSGDAGLSA